jgi:cellulose biosynthesis protein BcsQ
MGVICFSSLKGGVGKTTLAINIAAALAMRGGETLIIDLDPSGHTTRFFSQNKNIAEASLPRLFLHPELRKANSLVEFSIQKKITLLKSVRERLVLLPGGSELRHFFWGKGVQSVKDNFAKLIAELRLSFDYIVIDTAPDLNILVRNAIASSDIAIVPVDGSAMSIDCLNQLMTDVSHIDGPQWGIVRSMFSRKASKLKLMSDNCIRENLSVRDLDSQEQIDEDLAEDIEEISKNYSDSFSADSENKDPIYLLDSIIYRTEEQNKLSFKSATAFEAKTTKKLALEYLCLARELDALIMLVEEQKDKSKMVDRDGGNLTDSLAMNQFMS